MPDKMKAFNLLRDGANRDYIGENVSQLEHALQCAQMAETQGSDADLILAALFHDIGHLIAEAEDMGDLGKLDHESLGAEYLSHLGFSPTIAELVRGHVSAKRYLVATNKVYQSQLSEASKQTLLLQGGAMSSEQVKAFEADPLFRKKLQVRVWDEKAKVPGLATPTLEYYERLVK